MERREATEGGLTGILLTGDFDTEIGVAQGCQPIGKPREITRAEGRVILNWMVNPHWKSFKGTLQLLTQDDIRRSGGTVFVGIAMDPENQNPIRGDFLIRNLVGINEEHAALAVSEEVTEGQLVQFHLRNPNARRRRNTGDSHTISGENTSTSTRIRTLFQLLRSW